MRVLFLGNFLGKKIPFHHFFTTFFPHKVGLFPGNLSSLHCLAILGPGIQHWGDPLRTWHAAGCELAPDVEDDCRERTPDHALHSPG